MAIDPTERGGEPPVPPGAVFGALRDLREEGNRSTLEALLKRETERDLPVDRYEILEELGRGGMAVVHRARDRKLGRVVAALDHPGVVRLHDVVEEGPAPYLVVELLRGRTLERALADPAFPLTERLRVLGEAARAVHAAHAQGVVHRDLKPANVMIEPSGRVVVMLYEALTGQAPHRGTMTEVFDAILHRDPVPARRVDPGIPEVLATICDRAMARESRDRYASAGAFAGDLARFAAGESIAARPISTLTRLTRAVVRRKAAVAAAVAIAALAATSAALWEKTLKLNPKTTGVNDKRASAHADRGDRRRKEGDFKGAAEDYRSALKVAPSYWRRRASVQKALEQVKRGEEPPR